MEITQGRVYFGGRGGVAWTVFHSCAADEQACEECIACSQIYCTVAKSFFSFLKIASLTPPHGGGDFDSAVIGEGSPIANIFRDTTKNVGIAQAIEYEP